MWTRQANRVWRSETAHITRPFSFESEETQASPVWGLRLSVSQKDIEKSGQGKSRMRMGLFLFPAYDSEEQLWYWTHYSHRQHASS